MKAKQKRRKVERQLRSSSLTADKLIFLDKFNHTPLAGIPSKGNNGECYQT